MVEMLVNAWSRFSVCRSGNGSGGEGMIIIGVAMIKAISKSVQVTMILSIERTSLQISNTWNFGGQSGGANIQLNPDCRWFQQ